MYRIYFEDYHIDNISRVSNRAASSFFKDSKTWSFNFWLHVYIFFDPGFISMFFRNYLGLFPYSLERKFYVCIFGIKVEQNIGRNFRVIFQFRVKFPFFELFRVKFQKCYFPKVLYSHASSQWPWAYSMYDFETDREIITLKLPRKNIILEKLGVMVDVMTFYHFLLAFSNSQEANSFMKKIIRFSLF